MNTIDRGQLLQELRALAGQAGSIEGRTQAKPSAAGVQQFGGLFGKALDTVNTLQQQTTDLQQRVEMGDKSVSLVQAMVAMQKSGIAFQATVQVRNRLVSAYQDIMNMPI